MLSPRRRAGRFVGFPRSVARLSRWLTLAVAVTLLAAPAPAVTYYVSSEGDDGANAGLSPDAPWKTLARVSAFAFQPGDSILLRGGQTFPGPLTLTNGRVPGTVAAPITVDSYGGGQATIDGAGGDGIVVAGAAYLTLQNLVVTGAGYQTGNGGVGVRISGADHVTLRRATVSGFQKAGVEINGGQGVRVDHVNASNNGGFGLHCQGNAQDVYLGYCTADNNPNDPSWGHPTYNYTGSGIYVEGTHGALVEYCEASGNGYEGTRVGGGPVGIWTANASGVVIQYCVAHDNHTSDGAGDGDGFDLDGGVTNSVLQYCLSYHNDGSAWGGAQYQGAGPWKNNVIRYNVSVNDVQGRFGGGATTTWSWRGQAAQDGMSEGYYHNNLVYNDHAPAVALSTNGPSQHFFNNVYVTAGQPQIQDATAGAAATFQNNAYWSADGSFGAEGFTSLAAWRQATGQETVNGQPVGLNADPGLRNLPSLPTVPDPTQLGTLLAYGPTAASPLLGRARPVPAVPGVSAAVQDFFGTPLPAAGPAALGAAEYLPTAVDPGLAINAGGSAAGGFRADTAYSGGLTFAVDDVINTSAAVPAAPAAVYQTERYGTFQYRVDGLSAGGNYTVRLHFAEIWWGVDGRGGTAAAGGGQRIFNVAVNGGAWLTNFDVAQTAGGPDRAVVVTGVFPADASGGLTLSFDPAAGSPDQNAQLHGLEVVPAAP